ncbi:MAG: nitroreductase family protein [Proteobacteria bacterium]|nr:nitroreductase family protein [Pseudomonadota bacterium]
MRADEMRARACGFRETMSRRRSVRDFSDEPVPLEVVRECISAAATAPSGANKQPWTFVLVTDLELKHRIREGAESEERAFYGGRAPQRWIEDLAALGTDASKPFLETAPALIAVFAQRQGTQAGQRHYYVQESVGIAVGILIAALHHSGLATLTHTPSPMGFLGKILGRPNNERAYLLIPAGYPQRDCCVPAIERKPLAEVLIER